MQDLPRSDVAEATVVECAEKQWCRVRADGDEALRWARLAVAPPWRPARGDRVLLARGAGPALYVVGVLESAGAAAAEERATAEGGACAYRRRDAGGEERLGVRDAAGRVLFEFCPRTGRAELEAGEGGLALRTAGHLDLVAGRSLRLFGAQSASVESAGDARLGHVGADAGRVRADAEGVHLAGRRLAAAATETELASARARLRAEEVDARVGRLRTVARHLETVAEQVSERLQSASRVVEGLQRLVAGRVHTRARGSARLQAERVDVRGARGVRLDGERIDLG